MVCVQQGDRKSDIYQNETENSGGTCSSSRRRESALTRPLKNPAGLLRVVATLGCSVPKSVLYYLTPLIQWLGLCVLTLESEELSDIRHRIKGHHLGPHGGAYEGDCASLWTKNRNGKIKQSKKIVSVSVYHGCYIVCNVSSS